MARVFPRHASCVLLRLALLSLFSARSAPQSSAAAGVWSHGWASVGPTQTWVDFGARQGGLSPAQLSFLARNYAIISLEKCFNGLQFPGDSAAGAANASRGIRAAAAAAGVPPPRILFYFHSSQAVDSCYTSSAAFESQPSWWLRNKTGGAIFNGQGHMYNLSISAVRAHVASASVAVPDAATLFDGVFADGTADTGVPTMAGQPELDYFASHHLSVAETAAAVHAAMRPGALLFGNGLAAYTNNPPDHGLALAPYLDGFCYEHFNAFESLNAQTGQLVPSQFALALALIRNATAMGKPVLVRAWPGPACAPIRGMGPSWCGPEPAPDTYPAAAQAMRDRLVPALAGYLIVATELTYFSYSWWYTDKDGMFPCYSPGACSFPEGWLPELAKPLGAPLGDYALDAARQLYTREFAFASVRFNVTNMSASSIEWRTPPSATATPAPTMSQLPAGSAGGALSAGAVAGVVAASAAVALAAAAIVVHRARHPPLQVKRRYAAAFTAAPSARRLRATAAGSTRMLFNPVMRGQN